MINSFIFFNIILSCKAEKRNVGRDGSRFYQGRRSMAGRIIGFYNKILSYIDPY